MLVHLFGTTRPVSCTACTPTRKYAILTRSNSRDNSETFVPRAPDAAPQNAHYQPIKHAWAFKLELHRTQTILWVGAGDQTETTSIYVKTDRHTSPQRGLSTNVLLSIFDWRFLARWVVTGIHSKRSTR